MKSVVVGIGEALWDMLPEGKKIGGAPANFAYHSSQFGFDGCAISAIGKDALGTEIIETFDSKNLHYLLPQVNHPTGTVQVIIDSEGIPTYDIEQNVAWDYMPFTQEMRQLALCARAVCFGSLAQRGIESRHTIMQFVKSMADGDGQFKIFDINLRQEFYTKQIIEDSLKYCNVLKINDEELILISEMFGLPDIDMEDKCWILLAKYNLKMVILTCGVNGSYVFAPGEMSFQETPQVIVADTVGAGDSFTATFCASLLYDKSIKDAHKLAVEVSAYVCSQHGAMPILPASLIKKVKS